MKKLLVIDTETSKIIDPRVVEIALLLVDNTKDIRIRAYRDLVNPNEKISLESMAVHNITDEMVCQQPSLSESLTFSVLDIHNSSENIFIGHNLGFDINAIELSSDIKINARVIDTHKVAYYHHFDDTDESTIPKSRKINYLRYFYSLENRINSLIKELNLSENLNPHSALFDCVLCIALYEYFKKYYTDEEMIETSKKPIVYKNISFGKYENHSYDEICITDYQYVQWMLKSHKEKCEKKNMSEVEMKNDPYLITLLYYLDKYNPDKLSRENSNE